MKQQKTIRIILQVSVVLFFVFSVLAPFGSVLAQGAGIGSEITGKLETVNREVGLANPEGGPLSTVASIIKNALLFVGTIFMIFILYGGFMWMTAGGSSEQVGKAGSYIKNSIIGLVIIFASYAIVFTVFDILLKVSKK